MVKYLRFFNVLTIINLLKVHTYIVNLQIDTASYITFFTKLTFQTHSQNKRKYPNLIILFQRVHFLENFKYNNNKLSRNI